MSSPCVDKVLRFPPLLRMARECGNGNLQPIFNCHCGEPTLGDEAIHKND
ncbi:hypothetical protein [Candidatus Tisiphia endosymbiont of Hybos culiciformis]